MRKDVSTQNDLDEELEQESLLDDDLELDTTSNQNDKEKVKHKIETSRQIRNFTINETTISGIIITSKYKVTMTRVVFPDGTKAWSRNVGDLVSKTASEFSFKLTPTTRKELREIRRLGKRLLVLKLGDRLFYTVSDHKIDVPFIGTHCCDFKSQTCKRLSALPDEKGGCQKVRDVGSEKDISRYPFITKGIQIFNHGIGNDRFIVLECTNCVYSNEKKPTV